MLVQVRTGTSGHLLRQARQQAGLTQAQFASRAGTTQSVISAYESSSRQPSLVTLTDLVAATGYELDVRALDPRRRLDRLTGPVGRRVRRHRSQLVATAAAHGLTRLCVFGSVARGEDRADSDLDLLAAFPPGHGADRTGTSPRGAGVGAGVVCRLVPTDGRKPDVAGRVAAEAVPL